MEVGAGLEFPAAAGKFFIRPSYYHGLMNVAKDDEDEEEESEELHLRNVKIKAGFAFPL
jgi:hypothetical protein